MRMLVGASLDGALRCGREILGQFGPQLGLDVAAVDQLWQVGEQRLGGSSVGRLPAARSTPTMCCRSSP
ncbi:hypothetical protein [Streptomyces hokutonensis]|uniref:Uncharacterized protein n=1 Tax=Streptomyces hokutonensis TaxID=1306990 RepID=A0ABW6M1T3_9ACTN